MDQKKSGLLLLFTGVNFAITYATSVLLAQRLGVERYDEYAVAVALVTILSTLAELGTGKYAMRILPVLFERSDWEAARGYRRFAGFAILVASIGLALLFAAPTLATQGLAGASSSVVALLFLPALALVGYGAEVVQANGATLRAALLSRILVPGATLLLVIAYAMGDKELRASKGVALFGFGWVAGLLALGWFLKQTTPREARRARAVMTPRPWLLESLPFLGFALLVVVLTKISLVVFKRVADGAEVSVFAAALETGSFLYIVAKSTDKMFLPKISLALDRGDAAYLLSQRRLRLLWMSAVCAVFMGVMALFGREILSLYGPEFVEGYWPLVIVSAATAIWTLFSLAPSFLKYADKKRFVIVGTAIAVGGVVALTWLLGARFGAVGAAVAYGLPIATLYLVFAVVAVREIRALQYSTTPTSSRNIEQEDDDEFAF